MTTRIRRPFYEENRAFTRQKFTFKLSAGAVHHRPKPCESVAKCCAFCGSVKVLCGADSKKSIVFCDKECSGYWRSLNFEKTNIVEVNRKNAERRASFLAESQEARFMTAGFESQSKIACCSICDRAFDYTFGSVTCSKRCKIKLDSCRKRAIKPIQVMCQYCNETRWEGFASKAKKPFCGHRCARKAAKDKRANWARCNGRCEYISLTRLLKRDGIQCKGCGCNTTRYNGSYRATDASIDHVQALANGGTHTWDNVQVMCILCNSIKSDNHTGGTNILPDGGYGDTVGHFHICPQNHNLF